MGCHCLCAVNHPEQRGICRGDSDDLAIAFDSDLTGRIDVPMCTPCAGATLAAARASSEAAL